MSLAAIPSLADCDDSIIDLRGGWGTARFEVEIADTPALRSQGLMHRDSLPRSRGMLFVYERPTTASFWMKNTRIPLDLLFLDKTGQVVSISENAVPYSTKTIHGGDNIFAVLEINASLAAQLGIERGTVARHPRFDQSAVVWRCSGGD